MTCTNVLIHVQFGDGTIITIQEAAGERTSDCGIRIMASDVACQATFVVATEDAIRKRASVRYLLFAVHVLNMQTK